MYAVGHFALGYLTGKVAAEALDVDINIPLVFLVSVFPDIDILMPGLEHRGPLHSVLLFCLVFIPLFVVYKRRAAPYFVALIQHILIGDYLIGGDLQLLWPLTTNLYGFQFEMGSLLNIALEWSFFLVSMAVMVKTRDILFLFKPRTSNLILSIPILAVLLPTLLSFPLYVPVSLLVPHLVYMILFTIPILINLKAILTKTKNP
jgi:hypothetical protein